MEYIGRVYLMPHSSRGQGRSTFYRETGVQIPYAVQEPEVQGNEDIGHPLPNVSVGDETIQIVGWHCFSDSGGIQKSLTFQCSSIGRATVL